MDHATRDAFFKLARIERNLRRNHRSCRIHPKQTKSVCIDCTKVFCAQCGHDCNSSLSAVHVGEVVVNNSAKRKRFVLKQRPLKYSPPPSLRPHWDFLQRWAAIRLEKIDDKDFKGHWYVFFPSTEFRSADDLRTKIWGDKDWCRIADKSSLGIGVNSKKEYYAAFVPKE